MKSELINANNINHIYIYPNDYKVNDIKLKYKKGDIIKKEIKLFGITIRKEKIAEENIYMSTDFDFNLIHKDLTLEEILDFYFNLYYKDGKFYTRPKIKLFYIGDSCESRYFNSNKEMKEFLNKIKSQNEFVEIANPYADVYPFKKENK